MAVLRRRGAGVAFLAVLAMLVWLSILLYQKAFTTVIDVTLQADRIGNQLSAQADVKVRGLVVGRVTSVHATAKGADVKLALDPGQVHLVPQNVSARLLPKTLFGEKYVELVLPKEPTAAHLRNGDVIPQDRSSTALETERVLNDLLPLLKSLHPAAVSTTLNALSTALRDRGDRLGRDLVSSGAYFARINPAIPQAGADLAGLADLTDNIARATPDLLEALDNLSASSRNLVSERADLERFLTSTQGFASTAREIVGENEQRLTALAQDSLPVLKLFARYSPELPCFLAGLARYDPVVTRTFGGELPGLHITLELNKDNGGYSPGQEPKYRDTRDPTCWLLPHPRVPEPDDKFDDGYRPEGVDNGHTMQSDPALALVAAPALGVPAGEVPDTVSLLLGPVAQGNAVGLS
ncbi:MAG TPA: MCE family protein [Mycobacteriales bacterium]|nr:MCE family protein [Mycobacteriales bacterium]